MRLYKVVFLDRAIPANAKPGAPLPINNSKVYKISAQDFADLIRKLTNYAWEGTSDMRIVSIKELESDIQ